MIRVIVTGAAGRMGRMNIKVITEAKDAELVGAVDVPGLPFTGMDAGELAGVGKLNVDVTDSIDKINKDADVMIDFSSHTALQSHVDYAVNKNMALVCGITGLNDEEFEILKTASKSIPLIWAPNFSVGINLLTRLTRIAANVLDEGFDVEIIEGHHRMKKDAPSGTAIKLLNAVKETYGTEDVIYGRQGITGERPARQIGVHAIRGGDIVGDHTVLFAGIGERIELSHRASTRETFARGALRAARFIVGKNSGFYTMEDVLGLEMVGDK